MSSENVISGFNSFHLKVLAIVTMMLDHIGAILLPQEMWLRYVGRLAFPIFCFLLVEGFFHTRNVDKYIIRLGIFALVSEIPFNLAFGRSIFDLNYQNVFFTLFIGIVLMRVLAYENRWVVRIIEVLLAMWLANVLRTDYGGKGVLLISWFYFFREKKAVGLIGGALWNLLSVTSIQRVGAFAMIPIGLYNGEKGRSMKYFFYLFYPVHILILVGIRWYLL